MKALYLQGGGARGAFQGGAIKALYEKGIEPDIISATSIGAVNSYFLMSGKLYELGEMWNSISERDFKAPGEGEKVVENEILIQKLRKLEYDKSRVKEVYVNYVQVENCKVKEVVSELVSQSKEMALSSIKYSSLLPFVGKTEGGTKGMMEAFGEKLAQGEYEGYSLDGGIVNNLFTEPLERDDIDELYLIPLSNGYEIDEKLKAHYRGKKLLLIKPEVKFAPEDTLRFEGDFCRELFQRGYETAKKLL